MLTYADVCICVACGSSDAVAGSSSACSLCFHARVPPGSKASSKLEVKLVWGNGAAVCVLVVRPHCVLVVNFFYFQLHRRTRTHMMPRCIFYWRGAATAARTHRAAVWLSTSAKHSPIVAKSRVFALPLGVGHTSGPQPEELGKSSAGSKSARAGSAFLLQTE